MIAIYEDAVISADWHALHRNIYWFLPEARKIIGEVEDPTRLSYPEFIAAEVRTYQKIFDSICNTVEKHSIRKFYFLGDLVFGLHRGGDALKRLALLHEAVPVFFEIFAYLEGKKIARKMIPGNHDDFKLRNPLARDFYQSLFDDISPYLREGDNLYTHFPIGYSIAADQVRGLPEEKFFRMNKVFYQLDQKLLQETQGCQMINFHGHIHNGEFSFPVENVTYHNMALDWLALSLDSSAHAR